MSYYIGKITSIFKGKPKDPPQEPPKPKGPPKIMSTIFTANSKVMTIRAEDDDGFNEVEEADVPAKPPRIAPGYDILKT